MEPVYKNEDLLKLTKGSYYIHDAVVSRFDIYMSDYKLCIDVYFISRNRIQQTETTLRVHFADVIEYGFYYNNTRYFYNVERYKFFKSDKGYYLSLDPVSETDELSEDDQDFILCRSVEGNIL
ncbi:hypothetical protein HQ865_22395 [Mucilaginibacter mali]|uniref:Uncharacterized protein n=1 Tax=Mucilaginibacter mali TaxID=2740462 RepID=A0A7D4TQ63_9SPHI|nr:hypothetical protein [Mucilaginibacter mali]QKJ32393.1 hypothetical protein HQ865_22395 [Mucilaginibacter mali]